MKIQASNVGAFIKAPVTRVILLYGPDAGQVKDHANTLIKNLVGSLSDPFRVAEITKTALSENPAILSDEAAAISMMGGQRAVRIIGADDWLTKTLKDYLDDPVGDALIVMEGDELGPSSTLRKLCEGSELTAALPCYVDEGRNLLSVIDETLSAGGYRIDADGRHYLSDALGGDRMVVKGELAKLMLYMGAQKNITLADAMAAIGSSSEIKAEEIVFFAIEKNITQLIKNFNKLAQEDIQAVTLLRSALYHLQRLKAVKVQMESGLPQSQAIDGLRPPVFFKTRPRFEQHVRALSMKKIDQALEIVMESEALVKQTHVPGDVVAQQALLRMAS